MNNASRILNAVLWLPNGDVLVTPVKKSTRLLIYSLKVNCGGNIYVKVIVFGTSWVY